jgi:hypothetical protein
MDSGKTTMPKAKRYKIRAAVQNLEILARTGISWDRMKKEFNKVNGGVQLLRRLHPNEARKYVEKLSEIKKQALLHEDQ